MEQSSLSIVSSRTFTMKDLMRAGMCSMADNASILGWSVFWSYFVSPSCDDEMRLAMAKDLRLDEFLENIPHFAQVEVLQDAPENIIKAPSIQRVLKPKALAELQKGVVKIETTDRKEGIPRDVFERVVERMKRDGW
jgi:hypothetical protein